MVPAIHSSSIEDDGKIVYTGVATGYVMRFEDGFTAYFAGDTSVFGDMRLIRDMYSPTLAFLPIGDLFTMGPEQAAVACDLLGVPAGGADALRNVSAADRDAGAAARAGVREGRGSDRAEAGGEHRVARVSGFGLHDRRWAMGDGP